MGNVGEQLIPHGLYQCLCCFGIEYTKGVFETHLRDRYGNDRQRHDP